MLRTLFVFLGLTVWLLADPAPQGSPQPTLPKVTLIIGPQRVSAEVARTSGQLQQGLMFRQKMGDNEGMLFCLLQEGPASFWMQNTLLPLSVAYLDRSGQILEIHDMKPLDTTTVPSTSDKVYYALEMNQGWFVLNKVAPGEMVKPENTTLDKIRSPATKP